MLARVLEAELMDTVEDAREYDAMDHAAVNTLFVSDLLDAMNDWRRANASLPQTAIQVLDLGVGTCQIPVELARRTTDVHVTAVDAAQNMLAVARQNIAAAGLTERLELLLADAKHLPFDSDSFPVVISNSIVHHIAEPRAVIAEAVRVTAPGGLLFHRDLVRSRDEAELEYLVHTYAGDATPYQRKLFADSLRAALTVEEMQSLVTELGFPPDSVQMTSDRHWTWSTRKVQ